MAWAADSISPRPAVGLAEPDVLRDVPLNRKFSWVIMTTSARSCRVVQVAQVHPVEQNAAAARVVEPGEQPGHRRLARARRADQGRRLAGRDFQVEAAETGSAR